MARGAVLEGPLLPRHFIASEPHTPPHHHQDSRHLLVMPGQAWPMQQGWGCHRNLVTPLSRLHCLHRMLAHVSPRLACEVSTVMPLLQMRKLRFRAGTDWSRVPQLERGGARAHIDHTDPPPVHASSLQSLEKDGGMLANSRYQLTQPHSTLGNTRATCPSEPRLVEETGLSQNHMDCPNHTEAATAQTVIKSGAWGANGSATAPCAHRVPTLKRDLPIIILINDY